MRVLLVPLSRAPMCQLFTVSLARSRNAQSSYANSSRSRFGNVAVKNSELQQYLNLATGQGVFFRNSFAIDLNKIIMSSPVIVQGTAVAPPAFGASPQPVQHQAWESGGATSPYSTNIDNGDHQPAKGGCKDPIFALLFYINVGAIAAVAVIYGPAAFSDTAEFTYEGYLYAAVISAVVSLFISALGLAVLMAIPETMIKVSLIFVVVMSGVWAVMAFLSGSLFAGIIGLVFFAIGLCYARAVWSRYVSIAFCAYLFLCLWKC